MRVAATRSSPSHAQKTTLAWQLSDQYSETRISRRIFESRNSIFKSNYPEFGALPPGFPSVGPTLPPNPFGYLLTPFAPERGKYPRQLVGPERGKYPRQLVGPERGKYPRQLVGPPQQDVPHLNMITADHLGICIERSQTLVDFQWAASERAR